MKRYRRGAIWRLLIWVYLPLLPFCAHSQLKDSIQHLPWAAKADSTSIIRPYSFNASFQPSPYAIPDKALRYTPGQLTTPAILIGAGIAMDLSHGLKNTQLSFHQQHLTHFHTAADNVLLYIPAVLPYGLDLLGVPSKTDIRNRTAILIKAEIILSATGYLLKHTLHENRPDGSNQYSFPSGHSLQVFATATLLSEEYRDRYKWMPYAAYGLASGVGLLRIANHKHYWGDVLVGAGLGILSMKLAYWTHHYRWNKRKK